MVPRTSGSTTRRNTGSKKGYDDVLATGRIPSQRAQALDPHSRNVGVLTLAVMLGSSVGVGSVTLIWNLASTLALKADVENVATKSDIEALNQEMAGLRAAIEGASTGTNGLPALNERMNGLGADLERIETALNVERERVNDVQLFIGALQGREAARGSSGESE